MIPQSLNLEEMMLKAYRPPPAPDGGPHFMFDGHVLTHREFEYFLINAYEPVIVAGAAIDERNLVYLFDSQDSFEAWGQHTRYAKAFARTEELISLHREQNYVETPNLGVTVVSNAPIETAKEAIVMANPVRQSSALLYEGTGCSGRVVALGVSAIADLAEFEFSDSVCSARVSGVLMLSDEVCFEGYRFYLTGAPFIQVPDLDRWGFNQSARSAIVC
jgi:hypothetical protein